MSLKETFNPTCLFPGKMKYRLHLVYSLGIFPVEITSFMFLSQHTDTQAVVSWLNVSVFDESYGKHGACVDNCG